MSDDLDFSLPTPPKERERELEEARLRRAERNASIDSQIQRMADSRDCRRYVKAKLDARIEAALIKPEDIHGEGTYDLGEDIPTFLRNNIGIDEAYQMWIGKKMGRVTGDQQMVSCPLPDHEDNNPSASISLTKEVGNCHACDYGFDQIDLAAIALGFGRDYKNAADFSQVLIGMGTSLGLEMVEQGKSVGVKTPHGIIGIPKRVDPSEVEAIFQEIAVETPVPNRGADEVASIQFDTPYGPILKPDSFLEGWLESHFVTQQNIPPEYVLATGMIILGQLAGRKIWLKDGKVAYGNASFVLYGGTGSKKSTAADYMREFLRDVEHWDKDMPWDCEGTRFVLESNSGEDLISKFNREGMATPPMVPSEEGVKGIAYYDEFSGLFGRANRMGSTLKESLMQFMDSNMFVATSSRSGGDLEAVGAHVSALSTTQPEAVKGFLTGVDQASGFLNRWIYVPAALPPISVEEEYQIDLTEMKKAYVELRGWWGPRVRHSGAITVTDEARRVRQEWLRDNEELWRRLPATSRTELHLKRIALLFAINEKAEEIDENMMHRVLHLFETYLLPGFVKTDADIHISSEREAADEVIKVLEGALIKAQQKAKDDWTQDDILSAAMLTGAQIQTFSRHLKSKVTPEMFDRTLRALHSTGAIHMEKPFNAKKYRISGLGLGESS